MTKSCQPFVHIPVLRPEHEELSALGHDLTDTASSAKADADFLYIEAARSCAFEE